VGHYPYAHKVEVRMLVKGHPVSRIAWSTAGKRVRCKLSVYVEGQTEMDWWISETFKFVGEGERPSEAFDAAFERALRARLKRKWRRAMKKRGLLGKG
jgi:hypothetical protein